MHKDLLLPTIDLSVIIVSWNVKDYLKDCLVSCVESCRNCDYEIIVVDNASSDGSVAMVRSRFPRVKLIANKENLGFNRANNQGIRVSRGKYILLLNPDTVVNKKAIEGMMSFLKEHEEAGLVGPEQFDERGKARATVSHTSLRAFAEFSLEHLIGFVTGRYRIFFKHPCRVNILNGGCWMVKREVFEKVGLFNEELFLYGEEPRFCYLARKSGWKIFFLRQYSIYHFRGKSISQTKLKEKAFVKDYYKLIREKINRLIVPSE